MLFLLVCSSVFCNGDEQQHVPTGSALDSPPLSRTSTPRRLGDSPSRVFLDPEGAEDVDIERLSAKLNVLQQAAHQLLLGMLK